MDNIKKITKINLLEKIKDIFIEQIKNPFQQIKKSTNNNKIVSARYNAFEGYCTTNPNPNIFKKFNFIPLLFNLLNSFQGLPFSSYHDFVSQKTYKAYSEGFRGTLDALCYKEIRQEYELCDSQLVKSLFDPLEALTKIKGAEFFCLLHKIFLPPIYPKLNLLELESIRRLLRVLLEYRVTLETQYMILFVPSIEIKLVQNPESCLLRPIIVINYPRLSLFSNEALSKKFNSYKEIPQALICTSSQLESRFFSEPLAVDTSKNTTLNETGEKIWEILYLKVSSSLIIICVKKYNHCVTRYNYRILNTNYIPPLYIKSEENFFSTQPSSSCNLPKKRLHKPEERKEDIPSIMSCETRNNQGGALCNQQTKHNFSLEIIKIFGVIFVCILILVCIPDIVKIIQNKNK